MCIRDRHIGLGSNTDEGTQGVEQVNEEEREHDGEEVQDAHALEIDLEHLAEGLAQGGAVKADAGGGDDGVHCLLYTSMTKSAGSQCS